MGNLETVENTEDFGALLEQYLPENEGGEIRRGKITGKDNEFIYVDVGLKGLAKVKIEEIEEFNKGDEIEIKLISLEEDRNGNVRASRKMIEVAQNWSKLQEAFAAKQPVDGKIIKKVNGGYIVDVMRYDCFMPGSLSLINENDEDNYMNKKIKFMIRDIVDDGQKRKIVVSRREIRDIETKEAFGKYKVGDVVDAEVKEVLKIGLSVNVGGVGGFIHISEVSWKRLESLDALYRQGSKVKAKIIDIDEAKKSIKLSIKQTKEDPKSKIGTSYNIGAEVAAKIVKIEKFGAFAEIEEGVEGLIHISDLSWSKKVKTVEEFLKVGDIVKVKVIEVNPDTKKIKLGLKQMAQDPWAVVATKYPVGGAATGKVVEVKDYGLFVNLEEGVDAFVHVSDLGWIAPTTKGYKADDELDLQIIELDLENKKIKAGLKQLVENPWEKAFEKFKVGTIVKSKITKIETFGLFVELMAGIEGMVHVSESSKDFVKNLAEKFKVGDEVEAEVITVEEENRKIRLSIKKIEEAKDSVEQKEEQELIKKYSV